MTPDEYMREIVAPILKDLAANRSSPRYELIACLVTFHAIDYLAGTRRRAVVRAECRRQSAAFAAIDRIAHGRALQPVGEHPGAANAANRDGDRPVASGKRDVFALVNAAADFLNDKIRTQGVPSVEPPKDTYYVVIPFDLTVDGDVFPRPAQEVLSAEAAKRRARTLAGAHAGAVAFSRAGDLVSGAFEDAVVLAQFGEVDLKALNR